MIIYYTQQWSDKYCKKVLSNETKTLDLASNIVSALPSCSVFWLPVNWSSIPKYKPCLGLTIAVWKGYPYQHVVHNHW